MPSDMPKTGSPAGPGTHASPEPGRFEDEVPLLEIFNLLLRHRYRILGISLAAALIALAVALLRPPQYLASARFVPQGSSTDVGQLTSLASRLGVNVGAGDSAEESPAFYAELLTSHPILLAVATASYGTGARRSAPRADAGPGSTPSSTESASGASLPSLLKIDEDTPEREIDRAIEWLRRDAIKVQTDLETGLVTLSVTTPWPDVSHEIASRLVTLVHEFNLETRQSRAASERTFIEARLAEANDSLLVAESRLESFLQSNRQFRNSPELAFQHDRVQRWVARWQEIVTSLSQSYEQARVSEVRNTPVITLVESPERPVRPQPRNLPLILVLGLLFGGTVGVLVAFGRELMWRERAQGSDTYQEFSNLWSQTWWDLRTFGGRLS